MYNGYKLNLRQVASTYNLDRDSNNGKESNDIQLFVEKNGVIKVGIVGFGHMGSSLFGQLHRLNGFQPAIVATSRPSYVKGYIHANFGIEDHHIVETVDPKIAADHIAKGRVVITDKFLTLPDVSNLDVIVDATGNPEMGAKIGWSSLEKGKHLATFNIEADSVFGSLLKAKAEDRGVVYTGVAGDEPGAIMELYNFATRLQLQIVAVGKGKNNALRPTCTPDEFESGKPNPMPSVKSMCSFVDGTNTMIEMAAIANAIGFKPDIRGMHGPNCSPAELSKTFIPKSDGGILRNEQVVDYATGTVSPGVFVIVKADDSVVDSIIRYVYKGEGPYLSLFRPYHLLSLEAPISIADAVIHERTTISSNSLQRTADVVAVAKKNLSPGDKIDGIGGYAVRGVIENYEVSVAQGLLPVGVLENALVVRNVKEGQLLKRADVEFPGSSAAYELWVRQLEWLEAQNQQDINISETLRAPLRAQLTPLLSE